MATDTKKQMYEYAGLSHTAMKRCVSKPGVFPVALLVLTGADWSRSRHAPDKTRHDLSCLPVTDAIGSPPFKSLIRVTNRQTGLVWSGLVCLGVYENDKQYSYSLHLNKLDLYLSM
jgi:hypothetical protein